MSSRKWSTLKITIGSGETNVHSITIYNSAALSGNIDITSDGVASSGTDSKTFVTLQADAGNGALSIGTYYMAVLPGTYSNLSIAYKYTDHTAKAKAASESLTMQAGHVKAISVDFSSNAREAIQMWSGGPYFATMNLGETSVAGNTKNYSYSDAMGTGSNSVAGLWGYAWRVPTKEELDVLVGKAGTIKVGEYYIPEKYPGTSVTVYEFPPKDSGFSRDLFLPARNGDATDAYYWSSSAEKGIFKWMLNLYYHSGWEEDNSSWYPDEQYETHFVRPVIR